MTVPSWPSSLVEEISNDPVVWLKRLLIAVGLAVFLDRSLRGKRESAGRVLHDGAVPPIAARQAFLDSLEQSQRTEGSEEKLPVEEEPPRKREQERKDQPTDQGRTPRNNRGDSVRSTAQTVPNARSSSRKRPQMKATSDEHPGLAAFHSWYDVEASLYRVYTIGRTDGQAVAPPYVPLSRRGQVEVHMRIHNETNRTVELFWINHKGKEISKGKIHHRRHFNQFTWIEHPWILRFADTQDLVLHYIPYRVIPNTAQVSTISNDDPDKGMHEFYLRPPLGEQSVHVCSIWDKAMPHPAEHYFDTPSKAVQWTLNHMTRLEYLPNVATLIQYLINIVKEPAQVKYRQVRLANPQFAQKVWNTPARGLLLALGFVEHDGFAELGSSTPLSPLRLQDVSDLLFAIEEWKTRQNGNTPVRQPDGADGFGRAGFARMGLN